MKYLKKWSAALCLTVFTLVAMFGVITAEAAAVPALDVSESTIYLTKSYRSGIGWPIKNVSNTSQIKILKNSNKKVATVSAKKIKDFGVTLYFKPKKAGKTTVTFNAKYGKKTQKLKFKLTVKNYKNPVSSFKLGDKNYASHYKKDTFYAIKNPKKKLKLNVKLKNGWVLEDIGCLDKKQKYTNIENNTVVDTKNLTYIGVNAKDKNGQYQFIVIDFI